MLAASLLIPAACHGQRGSTQPGSPSLDKQSLAEYLR
jgi:mono/diheme cytochrome c family protein